MSFQLLARQKSFLFGRCFLFLEMKTSGSVGGTVFDPGVNAMSTGDRVITAFPEFDIMLAEVYTLLAGRFLHGDHLDM